MSPQPEKSKIDSNDLSAEFTSEERSLLLALAHRSIKSTFDNRDISLEAPYPHFAEPRGAFTTIYLHGELRGCVGYVVPVASLYRTVAETARAAAFDDTRFTPVTRDEAPHLEISLSILSLLQPIRAEEVEIGRHGLLISQHGHRGLLLPQVPIEHHWEPHDFPGTNLPQGGPARGCMVQGSED